MQSKALKPPQPVAKFLDALARALPEAKVSADPPKSARGEWWFDIALRRFATSVAWRPKFGFGVFASEPGYGERPDEVYRVPELAARRIQQLQQHFQETARVRPLSLADIRQLRATRQTSLAEELDVNQAAVSRLERRENLQLNSLHAYLEAMGGRLEMRVHFDSFDAALAIGTLADRVSEKKRPRRRRR